MLLMVLNLVEGGSNLWHLLVQEQEQVVQGQVLKDLRLLESFLYCSFCWSLSAELGWYK